MIIAGIGCVLLTLLFVRDYLVLESIIVLIAFVVVATNFCVDLIYGMIDPRINVGAES